MRTTFCLSIGAALMLTSTAFAQHRGGGGGHAGGGGAHVGGAHVGGVAHTSGYHPGGVTYHPGTVYHGGYSSGYRGGYYGGVGFGIGLGYPYYGGYGGYGYGLGGYGGYGYGGYGGYGGGYYSSPTVVIPQTYVVPSTTVAAAPTAVATAPAAPAAGGETGLRITDLKNEGTAKAAGLRRGDVILAVDGKRVQTFDELRSVLATAGKEVKVEFVDGSNGQIDQKTIKVEGTKIGVTVDEVPLTRS